MAHIDYYLSPVSPYVHMAGTRPARVAQAAGATIRYKPVDPGALFKRTGGQMLSERHPSRQAYRLQEMRRWSRDLGLDMKLRPAHWPTNPAPASYAIIAAQEAGGGDMAALVTGLTTACWEGERDIADDDVIRDCLSVAGFDPKLVDSGLLTGAEIFTRNLEEAVEANVFGFPFFVVEGETFWGQDRIGQMAAHLDVSMTE